jgi:ABC transporter substrate binding protein (PQQ-dependent alcohol dehydrogenase system)
MRRPLLPAAGLACALGCHAADFGVTLIVRANDPRLEADRLHSALLGHPGGPASEGVLVALKEAAFELDAAASKLSLSVVAAATPQAARAAAVAAEKAGAVALLADLPAADLLAAADAVKLPVINVGQPDDRLREADCRRNLLHTLPSERMRADAMAQALVARRWAKVLLLVGPTAEDRTRGATASAALRRFGLSLVETRSFKLSADPRERDQANPLLLTGKLAYDAVWVVDSDGEFARALPYRTALPRPVVGDAGLVALAWQAQFERFGAPQVSRRFARSAARPMAAHDWAAWVAGKALAAAAVAAPNGPAAAFARALDEVSIDGSKGVALSFRPWDGQLRQPLLLSDGQGVIGSVPIDGLLHPKNVLDTLGADAPEKLCGSRS